MLSYYPAIKPYATHALAVDNLHTLYVEECGNPQGLPILFVHGGPGAGCQPDHRRFFDPEVYRIVLFDQRGAGKSTPHAELEHNTTADLIADIEKIREFLHLERWCVFGGSWGSTLSLLYAQAHPERVNGLIVRGIFLGDTFGTRWCYQAGGASAIFPDHWQEFIKLIPREEQADLVTAYYQRLTSADELTCMAAAKAWAKWEAQGLTLQPQPALVEHFTHPHLALSLARIECHYALHHYFIQPDQILTNMAKLHSIPGIIVHGRYDIICPLESAWRLHQAWPHAELYIVRDAGHAASEPGITDALIHATKKFARLFTT